MEEKSVTTTTRQPITTKNLTDELRFVAESWANGLTITTEDAALALGNQVVNRVSTAQFGIDKLLTRDLQEDIGNALLDLENGMTSLDAAEFVNSQPVWADQLLDRLLFLKRWFSLIKRLGRRYQHATLIIEGRVVVVDNKIAQLTETLATKRQTIEAFERARNELVQWAYVGELKLNEVREGLETARQRADINAETDVIDLEQVEAALITRIEMLLGFATQLNQDIVNKKLSSRAETMLIRTLRAAIEMQRTAWKSSIQDAMSAIQTMQAVQINQRNRQVTETLLRRSLTLSSEATVAAVDESLKPLIPILLLKERNEALKTTARTIRERLAEAVLAGDDYIKEVQAMQQDLKDSLNIPLTSSNPA